ncbi:hypothetical protein F4677DRAFT_436752 [Hypoxylon crocopeplum]|nr:hypothetical protein F4677DRAFT_436752 [Hypoxylon crocopeplum]
MRHHQITAASTLLLGALTAVHAAPSSSTLHARSASPQCWYGSDFPAESDWLSFDALFDMWRSEFKVTGDTDEELGIMKDALNTYSQQGGFSPALATAMMIRESHGNTCTKCGDSGASCGLLQVHGAPRDCENKAHPCPASSIQKGIQCGTVGCDGSTGSSIKGCVASQGQKWGEVLRCYNSGSVKNPNDLRDIDFGDPGYVQQVANILLGADDQKLGELEGSEYGL